MRIEFTYGRSSEYFRMHLRLGALRAVRSTLLLSGVLVSCGIFVVFRSGDMRVTAVGIVAIVVAILLALAARHRYVDAVSVPAAWRAPRRWLITEDALESSTDLTSMRWTWGAVRRVEERPEAFLFWPDGPTMFDLPRAPLTPVQEAELRAHLVRCGLLWPIEGPGGSAPLANDRL
ncbi:YcxB family protein [Dactylosporangium sp. CA-139066]|uniref:YcxB family protein n=1 Tax=Dactylosporangium sp. CA-139066 TaxID=3239930 RepID=UPI003D8C50B4